MENNNQKFTKADFTFQKSQTAETFFFQRCNVSKISKIKVIWKSSSSIKKICNGCYGYLLSK